MTRNKLYSRLAFIGLILITLLIYYPPFDWAFVGDDYVQFDYIKAGMANPWAYFSLLNPYENGWYYRPLQLVWFGLLEVVFHYLPNGYYWVALLFHVLTVSVLYHVARQLKMGWITAVLIASLFAIHSHWVDVVSWLSSIAIVQAGLFSLLAVSMWLRYLERPSNRTLLLTLLFCLLTFWSHEESMLLPPFLFLMLLVKRLEIEDWRLGRKRLISNLQSQISKTEWLTFTGLASFTLAYIIIMFTRPNLTVDISSRETTDWFTYFTWPELSQFIHITTFRLTYLTNLLSLSGTAVSLFAAAMIALAGVWFWWGNRVVRLWLAWLFLHLAFIYLALWTQLPELYAGRHIYQGILGLVLAIGATFEMSLAWFSSSRKMQRTRRKTQRALRPQQWGIVLAVAAVTAVSVHHFSQIRQTQQEWLENVAEEAAARTQLAELFPTITPDSHFFAVRFPISPNFTRTVVQLWYDTSLERPGGSLSHLGSVGRADPTFVVLDYQDGELYNLMPSLQQYEETIFLWTEAGELTWLDEDGEETAVSEAPTSNLSVYHNPASSQLALSMKPQNDLWLSHRIELSLPVNSELQTAILTTLGTHYRVRLVTSSGEEQILYESSGEGGTVWQPVEIPLGLYSDTAVSLYFEVRGENLADDATAYWANPRLVRGKLEN
ncbi:hypothetical protein [Candidatus Leptofilum sp.]|uniref:hypothetical protein n=1 Tax=Candidatus Leptofilum sp. TaxID=3241576 RepID=UPI003B5AEBA0